MPREIISLQLGHHANFVGTHYWNTQTAYSDNEEIDHGILFRAEARDTWTPRMVLVDLKGAQVNTGSFGSLNSLELIQGTETPAVDSWYW